MDEVNREWSYKGCRSTIISNPFTLNGPFQESQELIKYKKRNIYVFYFHVIRSVYNSGVACIQGKR